MKNLKGNLEKFKDWYNEFHAGDSIELISTHEIEMFLKSRPREPEAINRNEQAKEFINKVLINLKDNDPDYVDIVNKEFWSLF